MAINDFNSSNYSNASLGSVFRAQNEYQAKRDQDRQEQEALLMALNQNPQLNLVNPDGTANSPSDVGIQFLQQLAQDPNSTSPTYVRQQLLNNPLISQLVQSGQLPPVNDLVNQVVSRSSNLSQGRPVYNPLFNDAPLRSQVQGANRTDDDVLTRLGLGIKHALGITGLGDIEKAKVAIDNQLSNYPKEAKTGIGKILEIQRAQQDLANVEANLLRTSNQIEIQELDKTAQALRGKIQAISESLSDAEKAAVQASGQQYLNDITYRNDLKKAETALTPRFQSTVDKETEIANLKQEYLSRGLTPSLSKLDSWHNGYARRYIGAHLDPEILFKDVAPEVVPWVAINFAVEAGAAMISRGLSIPRAVAKWALYFGGAANSAYQAIDQNIDNYFEQHGTTEGFSTLKSHIMEALAFGLDMYGGKMLGEGIPTVIDNLFKMGRKQAIETAESTLDAGLRTSLATNSVEPFKAAVKTVFNACSLKSVLDFVGNKLVASGDKAAALYGKGKVRQTAGHLILGDELAGVPLKGNGLSSLVSSTISSQASLAAENMMSETARQVGRQNGMDLERVVESGVQGLIAGPLGRGAGKAMQVTGTGVKKGWDKLTSRDTDMLTPEQEKAYEAYVEEALNSNANVQRLAYASIKARKDAIAKSTDAKEIQEKSDKAVNSLVNKHRADLALTPIAKDEEADHVYVDKKGKIVDASTEGAQEIAMVRANDLTIDAAESDHDKAAKTEYNKELQKIRKKAYEQQAYKKERTEQVERLKDLLTKFRNDERTKKDKKGHAIENGITDEFLESIATDAEREAAVKAADKDHSKLANATARAIEEGEEISKDVGLSKEELTFLNNVANEGEHKKNKIRDIVDGVQKLNDDEKKQLHQAIKDRNIADITKLFQPKPKPVPAEGAKPAEGEEAKAKEPEYKSDYAITPEAYEAWQKHSKQNTINPESFSEGELRDKGILEASDKIDNFEAFKRVYDNYQDAEAIKLQNVEAEAKSGEKVKEFDPFEGQSKEMKNLVEKVDKGIKEHNEKLRTHAGKKSVKDLTEEERARVKTEKRKTTKEEKEILSGKGENKYDHLARVAQDTSKDFWEELTTEEQNALRDKARSLFKASLFESKEKADAVKNAKTLNEFIAAYKETKASKSRGIRNYLSAVAQQMRADEQSAIDKTWQKITSKDSEFEYVTEGKGYKGYTERSILNRQARQERAKLIAKNKENAEFVKQIDAEFLFDKSLDNDRFLNFVAYQLTNLLEDAGLIDNFKLIDLKALQDRIQAVEPSENTQKIIDEDKQKEEKAREILLSIFQGIYPSTTHVSQRWIDQVTALQVALQTRANSGKYQNFKEIADMLQIILSTTEELINTGKLELKESAQETGFWNESDLYLAEVEAQRNTDKTQDTRKLFVKTKKLKGIFSEIRKTLDTANSGALRKSEVFAQMYEDAKDLFNVVEHEDFEMHLKKWISTHEINALDDLENLVTGKLDDIWDLVTAYWNTRNARMGVKESGNILQDIIQETKDQDVRDFFTYDEGKAGDVGTVKYWQAKWQLLKDYPALRSKLIRAFLHNKMTLATILGIDFKDIFKEVNLEDRDVFGRVKSSLFERINSITEWNKVAEKTGKNFHLQALLAAYATRAGLLNLTVGKEAIQKQFRDSLLEQLKQSLQMKDAFHEQSVRTYDNVKTLGDILDGKLSADALTTDYYVINGYRIRRQLLTTKEDTKLTSEETYLRHLTDYQQRTSDYFEAVKRAYRENNEFEQIDKNDSAVLKAFYEKRNKWAKENPDLVKEAYAKELAIYVWEIDGTNFDEEKKLFEQGFKESEPGKQNLEERRNIPLTWIFQYQKQNKDGSWPDWNGTWETAKQNGNILTNSSDVMIATTNKKNVKNLTGDALFKKLIKGIKLKDYQDKVARENNAKPEIPDGLEPSQEQFLRNHYGELIVYKWLDANKTRQPVGGEKFTEKDYIEFYQQFSNIFSYLGVKVPKYNGKQPITIETVTARDLNEFIDMIVQSSVDLDKNTLDRFVKAYKETGVSEINTANFFNGAGNFHQPLTYDNWLNTKQQQVVAKALAHFINNNPINNKAYADANTIAFSVPKDTEATALNVQVHERCSLPNKETFFNKRALKSILLYAGGFDAAVMQNPSLANNEAFQAMLTGAKALYGNIHIKQADIFKDLECDSEGAVFTHVIDVAVACGVSTFIRTSSETSEDFLNDLRVKAPGAYAAYSNRNNHLLDKGKFIESVGTAAARILGYKPGTIAYKQAVIRLGQIGVLGLEKSGLELTSVYVDRFSGDIRSNMSGQITNSIKAIQIGNPDKQAQLNKAMQSRDADGITRNWADKLLGVDMHGDMHLHTYANKIKNDIRKFQDDYNLDMEKGQEIELIDENGKINLKALDDKWKAIEHKDEQGNSIITHYIVKSGDMALLVDKDKNVDSCVVMGHAAIQKTDFTSTTNHRLSILAAQMRVGADIDLVELRKTFVAAGILKRDDATGRYELVISEDKANTMSKIEFKKFLEKHPVLKMMLYTNSKYGMNPTKRSGKDRLNTETTNLMDFRKMVADISEFFNLEGEDVINSDKNRITLYYNEINTVNNRLFVKSNVFNYREDKHWRSLTTVNDLYNRVFTIKGKDQQAQFAAPILFNFGLDIDKIENADQILDMWKNLNNYSGFQKLLTTIKQENVSYDAILTAIQEYNEGIKELVKAEDKLETKSYPTYTPAKGSPRVDGTYKAKPMTIEESFEAVTALSKLSNIQRLVIGTDNKVASKSRWLDSDLTNLDNLTFTGYEITIEIDGLTNGPSFKNIASPFVTNTDRKSFLLLGATGASSRYFNIVDAYRNGILDTYNLNGQFVKDDLTEKALREYFNNTSGIYDSMAYLKTLYSPKLGEEDDSPIPPMFMDDILGVMQEVFDRNFMKPSTMVINYEAGKASVIQTILAQLDRRFSEACADGKSDEIVQWYQAVMKLIGQREIEVEYVINDTVTKATIKDGWLQTNNGSFKLRNLSKKQLSNLSISHTNIAGLNTKLSDLFGKVYDAIAKQKEAVQRPYKLLGECAQTLAQTYDAIIRSAINKHIQNGKISALKSEYVTTLQDIIDEVTENVNAVIHVGIEGEGDKSELRLTKEEVTEHVMQAIGVYLCLDDKSSFIKSDLVLTGIASLGAGTVPMFIHSYDSSIVHTMLQKVMDAVNERTLTIHDADLVSITQLAGEWQEIIEQQDGSVILNSKGTKTIHKMNQGHYESGHHQIASFADICNNLTNAINTLVAKEKDYEIPNMGNLITDLRNKREAMFQMVLNLASQRRAFYNQQKDLAVTTLGEMTYDYQYSSFAGSSESSKENKEALGGFAPNEEQLTKYIAFIDSTLEGLISPTDLSKFAYVVEEFVMDKLGLSYTVKNSIFTKGHFNPTATKNLTSVAAFVNWLASIKVIKDDDKTKADTVSAIEKAILAVANKDPEYIQRKELVQSFQDSLNDKGSPAKWESTLTFDKTVKKDGKEEKVNKNRQETIQTLLSFAFNNFNSNEGEKEGKGLLVTNNRDTTNIRAISAGYYMNQLPEYLATSPVGFLLGLRNMTKLHSEPSQQVVLQDLLTPFCHDSLKIDIYDKARSGVIVYTDSFDYEGLAENFSQQTQLQRNVYGEKDKTYYNNLKVWFSKIQDEMRNLLDSTTAEQLVFTMRSDGDIWRILALQRVIDSDATKYGNRSIVVLPAISNLSEASPSVNEEVAVYHKLTKENNNLSAWYFTGTVPSHNVQLQQAVMGREINKSVLSTGNPSSRTPSTLVMNDQYNGATSILISDLGRAANNVVRKDEFGDVIHDQSTNTDLFESDLMTSGIHDAERHNYNKNKAFELSVKESARYVKIKGAADYVSNHTIEASQEFDSILGNDNSTVIVNTDASGEILSKCLTAYNKVGNNTLSEAYSQYLKQLKKKQEDYRLSNHTERDWQVYMTPVVITVKSHLMGEKVFIFKPTIDNSVTLGSLESSIDEQGMTVESSKIDRIKAGSDLMNILKRESTDAIKALVALRNKHAGMGPDFRVVIPKELLAENLLNEVSTLSPSWLRRHNSIYLTDILNTIQPRRVRIPVDNTAPYVTNEKAEVYLPNADNKLIDYINLHNVRSAQISTLAKIQQSIRNMDIESRIGEATKDTKISLSWADAKSYMGNVAKAGAAFAKSFAGNSSAAHGYRGTASDIPQAYKLDFTTDSILDYDKAGEKFNNLMAQCIEIDKARGIDTSLVEESMGLMSELVTLAYVRIGTTDSIETSFQKTLLPSSVNEREFLNVGTARNGESQSEAFMHEMLHTLWRHLNTHDPALRKKLTDMYNYVFKNIDINDFEDGLTLQNKAIMDAVFGKDTVDNVEEFLCYYLTNRNFHTAVNNMAKRKGTNIANVLESNTRGVFRKLLNTAQNLLKGKLGLEREPQTIDDLAKKALRVAMNYNNKYWMRKKNLIESATGEEISFEMITGLKEPAFKVIDKLYGDSVFTKAVQLAVQKIYKAFGVKDATAAYVSAHIGTTDEFNRITETGEQLADNLIEAKRDYLVAEDGFVNDLLSSLEGVSRSQYDYLILRTKSKAVIDQQREQLGAAVNEAVREILKDVPEKIAKHLTMQFIRTDMSSLFRNTSLDLNQIKEVLTDKKARDAHIAELERTFASDRYANYYRNAAKGLAQYLVTGFNPTGLGYRNAYEILAKAGSPNQAPVQVGSAIYNALDQLISLYTLDMLDTSKVNVFESVPVETLNKLAVIHNAVKDSDNKEVYFDNNSMHLHVPKGELHGGTTSNRYEIIPEAELEAYEWNGYKKVSDAELDPFLKNHVKEKYVMVRAAYKSPAVTTAGIFTMTNIFKERTKSGLSIGRSFNGQDITSKEFRSTQEFADLRAYIQARIENLNSDKPAMIQKQTSGNLLLNFNLANFLTGATFEVNPVDYLSQTGKNIHITSVLGDLYGSTIERTLTPKRNAVIAQSVISIYEDATDKENFVWVAPNSENEHYRELYDRLPTEVKEAATEKYGDRGLPVRLKALNTVFGYANLSANDTKKFIEEERKSQNNADKLASQFSICARNIFYNKYLGNAETFVRWLAKVGKNQVVVKGLTTSWFNVLSNCVLLCMNGLSPKQMLEYQLDGLRQFDMLRQYKYQLRLLKQKQLAGTYTDADAAAESSINKSIKSLPIYALIENGVIANTIAEDRNETEALVQNAIKAVIPKGMLQTVANNFMITPNSYLYQILADFASLGDIGGKWALYRYNTERHLPPKEAARLSLNAFIDYSNPLPKQLQLVDDFAVLPFMKYAMGIQNNLARLAVKSPGRTLSWLFGLNTILDIAHPFQSLLTPQSAYDRMQLPGELFFDSLGSLPSNRILNWYGNVDA